MSRVSPPDYVTTLFTQGVLRAAGVFGAIGALIAALGDLSSAFLPAPPPAMNTVLWLSLAEFVTFLTPKTQAELLVGHYLGVLFIPLNVLGLWHVYLGLAHRGGRFPVVFLVVGTFIAVAGAAFHGMVGLAVTAVRAGDGATLEAAQAYFEPFGWILVLTAGTLFLGLAGWIVTRRSAFPRWVVLLSPGPVQLWILGLAYVVPLDLSVALLVSGFNLSIFVFLVVSTVTLWAYDPLNPGV
ncbi:MAG: hypothetical protein H6983_11990 [Ectothiorhodospiraceae bacterium]|nr:hypothetical protein [Chromatiales bacterium]MCP5154880.1 hypothetical protein [Ectothiorhodospiraceae bacterium]